MSIGDHINGLICSNRLYPLVPKAPGQTRIRAMLVDERLWEFLNSPEGDDEWEERVGQLQADLEMFATSRRLTPKYLFLLHKAEEAVWEIRSVATSPSIRVLGRFPDKDVFVATNFALRSDLGGWQSRAWRDVKVMSRTVWVRLFHTYLPIITTKVHEVVTGARDGKYYKRSG